MVAEDGNFDYVPEVTCFPYDSGWIKPIESWALPQSVRSIYRESIEALNHKMYRLSGAGFRACVEAICNHLGIEGRTLENKINKLTSQGFITKKDRDRLHAIRFIGNDSIHDMKEFKRGELDVALSIVNGILNNLFVIEDDFMHLSDRPITSIEDFEELLDEELSKRKSGEIDTLKNFLKKSRRIIREDIPSYENVLIDRIEKGIYRNLSLCPKPDKGPRQFKIR